MTTPDGAQDRVRRICSHRLHFTHAASGVRYGVSQPGEHNERNEPCRLSNPDSTTDMVEAGRNGT